MSTSEDEYDNQLGAVELSEEDCAKIDALSSNASLKSQATRLNPVAHIELELENPETSALPGMKKFATSLPVTSPFRRYRHKDRLSVSDLVAPTWCEVQFEYGLQQQRSKRLEKRPDSFITREGRVIQVEKKTAQLNDIVLREGHAIHTALEREIHPKQIPVQIETLEDEWGLRLINMLNDVQTLMLIGKCREFPVVGFIHDHLVTGIIDEINRVPLDDQGSESRKRPADNSAPGTPQKPKSQRSSGIDISPPGDQLKLTSFFPITPKKGGHGLTPNDNQIVSPLPIPEVQARSLKVSDPVARRTHTLYLVDSKTRLSPSLPQDSATLSSRLQLMLYKRLLDVLVSSSSPVDFTRIWKHIGLDSQRNFSETFLEEASRLDAFDSSEVKCLKDLENRWWDAVHRLGINGWEGQDRNIINPPVNDRLTLVYRLRAAGQSERRKGKSRSLPILSSEDRVLQAALKESLRDTAGPTHDCSRETRHPTFIEQENRTSEHDRGIVMSTEESACALNDSDPSIILDPQLAWAVQESLRDAASLSQVISSSGQSEDQPSEQAPLAWLQSGSIIGQKEFQHSDTMLDTHLTNVLQWWHGVREPRGVAVEDAYRCHTCEYISGCEWREKKSLEALEQAKR